MRSKVSLLLAAYMLALFVSGVVLFIAPPGRIAYWVDWRLLGLNKDQWEMVHIIIAIFVLLLVIWHLVLNWKPFVKYFNPALYIKKLRSSAKRSWKVEGASPPFPHAELATVGKLRYF